MISLKFKGTTIVVLTGYLMSGTRLVNNRIYRLTTKVDGTVVDLIKKVERIGGLADSTFIEFSELQSKVLLEEEEKC